MTTKKISKKDIGKLLNGWSSEFTVFVPSKDKGVTEMAKWDGKDTGFLKWYRNTVIPAKSIFLPPAEEMFSFQKNNDGYHLELSTDRQRRIIFGIRPCDAKSLSVLDFVFKGDYEDPYYLEKRKNTFLVGVSCTQPAVNCFCTSFDNGPASSKHVDVLLTDIGDKYFVEIQNEKGKQLVESTKKLFTLATEKDSNKKKDVEKKAIDTVARHMNIKNVDALVKKLDSIFDAPYWKNIAMKCLGCGACTYLCPTCHCFDIQDETTLAKGARIRVWDSCMRPEYTLQTSGYNPRPGRMNRVRNRVYHKYNYYPKNHKIIACVGCGRCIDNCPVNIDIIDVITKAAEVKP